MSYGQRRGPPSWFVILLGTALVFGIYYMWLGIRNFMASGLTVVESTRQAIEEVTATAERVLELETYAPTPLPTQTSVPPCQDFAVAVASAIVRSQPTTRSSIVESLASGEEVCVIARHPQSEWYVIDSNPLTRRLEPVYMHQNIIRPLHPTPTPSKTLTPAPTVTAQPSPTPSAAPSAAPSKAPLESAPSPVHTAAPIPSETPPSVNL